MIGCFRAMAFAGPAAPPPGAHPRFEWLELPEGAVALGALAGVAVAVALVVWLSRAESGRARPWVRWTSCALRLVVLGLVVLILLQPTVALDVERFRPAVLVFLADRSASMSTVDRSLPDELARAWSGAVGRDDVRAKSRHQLLRDVLAGGPADLLWRCRSRNSVRVMTFADEAQVVLALDRSAEGEPRESGPPALPAWQPTGAVTDLAGAIRAAVRECGDAPPAGIVLLSDGRQTASGSPEDAARDAARAAMPIYAVGIGDPSQPRNVSLLEILCDSHVMKGNPLRMQIALKASGFEGRVAGLSVEEVDVETGERRVVGRRTVRLGPDGVVKQVEVEHSPEREGEIRYRATVEPLEGESRRDDNTVTRRVTVLDERVRVLLVASAPSREYRFLGALLERDPGFELSVWLQSKTPGMPQAGNAPLTRFPARREDVLYYDAVLLLDPDPHDFSSEWVDYLSQLVERHGGGLVWVASTVHTGEFFSRPDLAGMRALLPVVIGRGGADVLLARGTIHSESWPLELTAEGASHQVTQVRQGRTESEAFWAEAPGFYRTFPVEREKPGATVLLRYKNPSYRDRFGEDVVLAALQPYGAGRTFFLGCDETWRWRALGAAEYRRFWIQLLRYLVKGRLLGGRKRAQILLESASFGLGEPVRIRAYVFDRDFRPLAQDALELGVEQDGARVDSVVLRRAGPEGSYEGVFYPEQYGQFDLVYTPPGGEAIREPFRVTKPALEMRNVTLAAEELRRLAEISGGSYVEPEQISALPDRIRDAGETVIEPGRPIPLWDRGWLMAVMIACLGAQWLLREVGGKRPPGGPTRARHDAAASPAPGGRAT